MTAMEIILPILFLALIAFLLWAFGVYFPRLEKKEDERLEKEIKEKYPTDTMQSIDFSENPYISKDYEPEIFPEAFKRKSS